MNLFAFERKDNLSFLIFFLVCFDFYDAVLNLETMKCLVLVCSTLLLLFAFSCDHIHELCARFCSFVNGYQRADLHVNRKSSTLSRRRLHCTELVCVAQQWLYRNTNSCGQNTFVADGGF